MNYNNFYIRIQKCRLTNQDTQNQELEQNIFKIIKDHFLLERPILHACKKIKHIMLHFINNLFY